MTADELRAMCERVARKTGIAHFGAGYCAECALSGHVGKHCGMAICENICTRHPFWEAPDFTRPEWAWKLLEWVNKKDRAIIISGVGADKTGIAISTVVGVHEDLALALLRAVDEMEVGK